MLLCVNITTAHKIAQHDVNPERPCPLTITKNTTGTIKFHLQNINFNMLVAPNILLRTTKSAAISTRLILDCFAQTSR
jgi:hypothetical protein